MARTTNKLTRRDVSAAARAQEAMQLRKLGVSYQQIANRCGYASRSAAYTAIQRELGRTMQEPADELRKLEAERLNDLWLAMAPKAVKGDNWAVDRCLAIMERRARLLGLDVPTDTSTAQMVVVAIASDVLDAV